MSETAEQIQNPVLPEPPVAELPAPSLSEFPPQAPAPEVSQPDGASQDEANLSAETVQLWQVHQDCQTAIKHETQQFRSLRGELGRLLHQMKALLSTPGRNGKWSSWLKERRIPRATADRLVLKFERSLHPDSNCLSESITEPTEAEIQTLLDRLLPKLRKALPTPASSYKFIELLVSSLTLVHQASEEGLTIVKPVQKTAVVEPVQEAQHEPVEAPAEPVPVIADVPVETHSESAGTSMA
jgi:hypothetical protein